MKRSPILLLFIVLMASIPGIAPAQTTESDASSVFYWNDFESASWVPAFFQSITTNPATQMIPGSDTADANGSTFALTLPFGVYFLGNTYPAGTTIRVSAAGFVSFTSATTVGTWPYLLGPDASFRYLIMPYWSDLETTGSPGQGIFYLLDIDRTTHDSTLTLEWNVQTMSPPFSSGRFQLRLVQVDLHYSSGAIKTVGGRTEIQFAYDNSSPIDRSNPYGAQVGIKNLGQDIGLPPVPTAPNDDDKFVLMVPPGATPGGPPAVTRLPTRYNAGTMKHYTPDYYPFYVSPASPYFHHTFPSNSQGYKIKPIQTDMDLQLPPPGSSTTSLGNVFTVSSTAQISLTLRNRGLTTEIGIPVHTTVTLGSTVVVARVDSVPSLDPDDSTQIPLTLPTSTVGEYTVVSWVAQPLDQNRSNDTASITYDVRPARDGMASRIVSPQLIDVDSPARYVTGQPIQIRALLANCGTLNTSLVAGYQIRDTADSVVGSRWDTLAAGIVAPGTTNLHTFSSFVPVRPGIYRIDVTCSVPQDQITGNNVLHSIPERDWISHPLSSTARGVRPIPFEVFYPVELAAGAPTYYPHLPYMGDTVHGTTHVMAMFLNNGGLTASNVVVHARIVDSNDTTVYNRTDTVHTIASARRTTMHYFSDFTPTVSGRYCITVWIAHDTRDSVPANDTATWCFEAAVDSSSGSGSGGGLSFLDHGSLPTPVVERVSGASSDGPVAPGVAGAAVGERHARAVRVVYMTQKEIPADTSPAHAQRSPCPSPVRRSETRSDE